MTEATQHTCTVNIIKKEQSHRYRKQTTGYQWGEREGRRGKLVAATKRETYFSLFVRHMAERIFTEIL